MFYVHQQLPEFLPVVIFKQQFVLLLLFFRYKCSDDIGRIVPLLILLIAQHTAKVGGGGGGRVRPSVPLAAHFGRLNVVLAESLPFQLA